MSVNIVDVTGKRHEVDLHGVSLYREAGDKKLSFRQLVNQKFPTAADQPEAFKQLCAGAGLRFKADKETGQPASTLREVLDPIDYDAAAPNGGTYTAAPVSPDSRILFPAAIMEIVEDSLMTKEGGATAAFESLIGYRETVANRRVEQPVISYAGDQGPEDSTYQRTGQNSRPPVMLSLKASDISRVIPSGAIGMEISDEAMAMGLDLVTKTLSRFSLKNDYAEWIIQLGLILNGDPDGVVTPMSAGTSALSTFTANSLTAATLTAGNINQEAWLNYLYKDNMKMVVDTIVCDKATAFAIENRADRPTNQMENSVDRLDAPYKVIYPNLPDSVNMIIAPEGTMPANTIMGVMTSDAIAKITSSVANYSAIEAQVMKRSTEFRWDRGFLIYRLFDDAFQVMTLTV